MTKFETLADLYRKATLDYAGNLHSAVVDTDETYTYDELREWLANYIKSDEYKEIYK